MTAAEATVCLITGRVASPGAGCKVTPECTARERLP
jgi:hypothetical protein